jgi:hypothetical protein
MLLASALVGCVGKHSLGDNQACPCAPGWTCDATRDVCVATTGSCPAGTLRIPGPGSCAAPAGHVVPYKTVADLEALIQGDWLRCSGTDYAAQFGPGLRISPDHTWSALATGDGGALEPITSGFDGYGTWTADEVYADHIQINLLIVSGGGTGGFATFTDTGQMRLDNGNATPPDYVRLSGGGGCVGSGAAGAGGSASTAGGGGLSGGIGGFSGSGGAGGASGGSAGGGAGGATVTIPGPGDCAAPDGHALPYTTLADLEALIEGDWLKCSGTVFFPGIGVRISPDHTWNSLEGGDGGALQPITTGFDGYGTWTDEDLSPVHFQFNLLKATGGGAGYVVTFTDSGQVRLDFGDSAGNFVRLAAGDAGAGP